MTRNEKFNIKRRTVWRNLWQRLGGVSGLSVKLALAAVYLAGAAWAWSKQDEATAFADTFVVPSPMAEAICNNLLAAYLMAGAVGLLALLLYPFGRKAAHDQLQSIGLANRAGMSPDLLRKRKDKDNPHVTV